MKTISTQIIKNNNAAFAIAHTSVWNVHNSGFGRTTNTYKDADKLAAKIVSTNPKLNFDVYAVVSNIGRGGHTKSNVILLAVPADTEIDTCGRISKLMLSVS
jgi:hypothetical protein